MSKKSNNKNIRTIISVIILLIILFYGKDNFLNSFTAESREIASVEGLENITVQTGESCISPVNIDEDILRVYFFDVGQADSILIVNNGESMLIDAGNNDDGNLIVENLKKIGITKLNYAIGTHPHEDHIGGLDDVINNVKIDNFMMPKTISNTTTYEDVIDALIDNKLKITVPKIGDTFNIGNAQCEVMCIEDNSDNKNLSSIVIRLEYDGTSYLFTGDAEKTNEQSRSWPQTNILKAGHHGSSTSSSLGFLKQINPSLIIISVGENNDYGHPHKEIIERYKKLGATIYRTDESGNILVTQSRK